MSTVSGDGSFTGSRVEENARFTPKGEARGWLANTARWTTHRDFQIGCHGRRRRRAEVVRRQFCETKKANGPKLDPEANVWVATSDDVPGLATEAETIEALATSLRALIPDLLEANE
jgi:hypothetical protein